MLDNKCKECGSADYEVILDISNEKDTYLDYLKIDYSDLKRQYWKCNECGLIYRNIILDENGKELLYKHFRDYDLRNETIDEYFNRIVSISKDDSENHVRCEFLSKYIPGKGKILDVGCGAGVFLYTFKEYYREWDVLGVEPTEGLVNVAKKNNIPIISTYLKEDTLDDKYDLITLNQVIEHIHSYNDMLQLVKKYLKSSGLLYIDVPSSEDFGYSPKGHDRFMCQHETVFSKEILEKIMKENGYELIMIENYITIRKNNDIRLLAQKNN